MARISSTEFRLFSTMLEQAHELGKDNQAIEYLQSEFGVKPHPGGGGIPYALRWITHPSFAFPRQPFKVWRRRKRYKHKSILVSPINVSGSHVVSSNQGEVYRVEITLNLLSGQSIDLDILDKQANPIPGMSKHIDNSGFYAFQSPFMVHFRFAGQGKITQIRVVVQSELINDPSWELIQKVGFPFKSSQISAPDYEPDPQGWEGTAPVNPRDFCRARLTIGHMLHEDMPALPAASLPTPLWAAPDPGNYLFELADTSDSLMNLINDCLVNTDDGDPDAKKRQGAYLAKLKVDGLRQDGFSGNIDPAEVLVPVVATTLLSTSTDNYASLGLGYGTYDFSPYSQENHDFESGYDYMVTNEYLIRPFDGTIFNFNFTIKVEFAALSEFRPRPVTPNIISIQGKNKNRPLVSDTASDETVEVKFSAPSFPQGYGIVKSDSSSKIYMLNNELLHNPNSYNPHIPNIPNPENISTTPCEFVDSISPIPLHGSETFKYFLVAIDIFGRWSGYGQRNYIAQSLPPQRPGLVSLRLSHIEALLTSSSSVACKMEIDCTWDWTERSPEKIQIAGGFYPADSDNPPSIEDRFAHESSNALLPRIEITFNAAGQPFASGADHVVDEIIPADPSTDPNLRRYKIQVSNVTGTFPGPLLNHATPPDLDPSKVAFAATARALEHVQSLGPSPTWSPWVAPVVDALDDPRPPIVTPLVAQVNWTALPDAANIARGKLTWSPFTGAAGYVVWEAPETALREFLGLAHRPDDSYSDRATELMLELADATNEMDSLKAFIRLNRDLVRETHYELNLPGSADTLFVYRVSAISVSNVESERTNATYFAVPRQNIPGQPRLKLEVVKNGSAGIDVIALEGAGPSPAGYKVYRVRKSLGSNVVQMKGLPVIMDTHSNWSPYQLANLDGSSTNGMKILDPVSVPSWKPYYYQIVAVGEENSTLGLLRGESQGSPTEAIFFPPDSPPSLLITRNRLRPNTHYIAFTSNTPLGLLSIGKSTLEIISYQPENPGEMPKRKTIFSGDIHKIKETKTRYRPNFPTLPDISEIPEVVVLKGTQTFYVRMNPAILTGMIKVRDPLGRATEVKFDEP